MFIGVGIVLYRISKHNNTRVALSVLGDKQKGNILVIDRFSVLRSYAEKAGFKIQYCWSHILGDSKKLAEGFREGRYIHRKLKEMSYLK